MAQDTTNLSTTTQIVQKSTESILDSSRVDKLFSDLLSSLSQEGNSILLSIAEANSTVIKDYLQNNISREQAELAIQSATKSDIDTILDRAYSIGIQKTTNLAESDFPSTSSSVVSSIYADEQATDTTSEVENAVETSSLVATVSDVDSGAIESTATSGRMPFKDKGKGKGKGKARSKTKGDGKTTKPPKNPSFVRNRNTETAVSTYITADLLAFVSMLPELYTSPGPRPNEALQVYRQSTESRMPAISAEMRSIDAERTRRDLTAGLQPIFQDQTEQVVGSIDYITQGLSIATSPEVISMVEAKSPKLAEALRFANSFFSGNFGTAAELNTALNTGMYGAGTAQLVAEQIRSGVKDVQEGNEAFNLNAREFNLRQYRSTAEFLGKTSGYQFEGVTGITHGILSREEITSKYEGELPDLIADYLKKHPDKTEQQATTWATRQIALKVEKEFIDQGKKLGPYKIETLGMERHRLEQLSVDRRKLGLSAMAIMSNESKQELIKAAGGDINMATMLAADKVLSMYGGQALDTGDFDTAIQQTQTLMHTAFQSGLSDKDIEEQAKAIGTALGTEDVALMPAAINASLLVQRDLQSRGVYLDDKTRAEVDQQFVDAIKTKNAGDLAWFATLNITGDDAKSRALRDIQTKLKTGKPLDSTELGILSRWSRNKSEFVRDISEVTGMSVGNITTRLDDNTRQTAMMQLGEQGQLGVLLATRQVGIQTKNEEIYTPGAINTRVGAYKSDLEGLGSVETISQTIQTLGANGLDWSSLLQGSADDDTIAKAESLVDNELMKQIRTRTTQFRAKYKTARDQGKSREEATRMALDTPEAYAIQQLNSQIQNRTYNPNTAILDNQYATPENTLQTVEDSVKKQKESHIALPPTGLEAFGKGGTPNALATSVGFNTTEEQQQALQKAAAEWENGQVLHWFNQMIKPVESITSTGLEWLSGLIFPTENPQKPKATEDSSPDVSMSYPKALPVELVGLKLNEPDMNQIASMLTTYTPS